MAISRSIHVSTNDPISFLFMANTPLYMHTTLSLSTDGQAGFFHVLAIVNSAAMNVGVQVCLQVMVFSRYMPRCGVSGSYSSSSFSF